MGLLGSMEDPREALLLAFRLVIVPPLNTQEMAEERLKQGYECKDWYFCMKKL